MEPVEGIVLEANKGYYYQYQTYLLPVFSSHEITKPLLGNYQILLGNAQAVKETEDKPDNVTVTALLETSDQAYSKLDGVNITTYEKESGDIDGPFYLAAAAVLTGMKPLPRWFIFRPLLFWQTRLIHWFPEQTMISL